MSNKEKELPTIEHTETKHNSCRLWVATCDPYELGDDISGIGYEWDESEIRHATVEDIRLILKQMSPEQRLEVLGNNSLAEALSLAYNNLQITEDTIIKKEKEITKLKQELEVAFKELDIVSKALEATSAEIKELTQKENIQELQPNHSNCVAQTLTELNNILKSFVPSKNHIYFPSKNHVYYNLSQAIEYHLQKLNKK